MNVWWYYECRRLALSSERYFRFYWGRQTQRGRHIHLDPFCQLCPYRATELMSDIVTTLFLSLYVFLKVFCLFNSCIFTSDSRLLFQNFFDKLG